MANILVTGGAGYIGSHTAKILSDAGHCPIVYDNLQRGNRWAVQWGPLVEADLGARDTLIKTMRDYDIAAVLHFAAFAFVGESMTRPELYFENNVTKSLILMDAMREAQVKTLVFSSTCATYGIPESVPITEDFPQRPVNPYGESKLMIEQALRWHGEIHGLSWVALRYFNASGADASGRIGEAHDPETHLIPLVLDAASGRRARIDIFGDDYATPDGTCIRDYIHVTDLADAHVRAFDYLAAGGASRALNLGTGEGHSVKQVIDCVEAVTGLAVPRRVAPRRAGDPASLVADPTAARAALGWVPEHSALRTIVETAWAWHQHGMKPAA